jgi:hypothetical protein
LTEPVQRNVDLSRLARRTSRALLSASRVAAHEFTQEHERRRQAEAGENPSGPPPPTSPIRTLASVSATRAVHSGFLLAVFATFIVLVNIEELLGKSRWFEWVRLGCAGLLVVIGVLLAKNWIGTRDRLVSQRAGQNKKPASRSTRPTWRLRILCPVIQAVGTVWIGVGVFGLVRATTTLF